MYHAIHLLFNLVFPSGCFMGVTVSCGNWEFFTASFMVFKNIASGALQHGLVASPRLEYARISYGCRF